VSGLVTRPYKEGKKGGMYGVMIGVYSGVSGLVLKPFSGGLDLFAKSFEGVKNTVKIFEAKVYNDRLRLPRTFYGN
jgi:vacuolar protein sorting-associated protein 13A/C